MKKARQFLQSVYNLAVDYPMNPGYNHIKETLKDNS